MRVLITGGGGFIGIELANYLKILEYDVECIDLIERPSRLSDSVNYRKQNLNYNAKLTPEKIDCLIHLAWDLSRPFTVEKQSEQVLLLKKIVQKNNFEKIITPGTSAEFGTGEGLVPAKIGVVNGLDKYGWAKTCARIFLEKTGLPVFWLRPSIVYGAFQSSQMLIPYALHKAFKREQAHFSSGQQVRDFIYIKDLIKAFVNAVEMTTSKFTQLNLGFGKGIKVKDAILIIADIFDAKDQFEFGNLPLREGEPKSRILDIEETRKILNWVPEYTPEMGLNEAARILRREYA